MYLPCSFSSRHIELGYLVRYYVHSGSRIFRTRPYGLSDYVCDYNVERLAIAPNGDVLHCVKLISEKNFILGNIRKDSLRDIWLSDRTRKIKELRVGDYIAKIKKDIDKYPRKVIEIFIKYFGVGCPANSYLFNGRFDTVDPITYAVSESLATDRELRRLLDMLGVSWLGDAGEV